jgi:DNA-damage-inducible protein D
MDTNDKTAALVVFQDKKIRRVWFNNEWWFVVEDVVFVLIDSKDVKQYINKMRQRDKELNKGWVQFVHTLPLPTLGGLQSMNCANTKSIFRLIQSIPSPKAEPFKLWLAQVGYERVEEIQNPELAQERMKELYEQKGYSKSWIDKRLRGIAVRQDLTDEWEKRGVTRPDDFAILTAEISKASFDMTPNEYKKFKGLKNENLRDHMTDLELIFNMLGEASTTEIEKVEDPKNFDEHKTASREGGNVAKIAREVLEKKTRRKVVTNNNFLDESENKKRLEKR